MCVAVIVESKERIPSDYLKAMAEHNPDGGGIAWIDGDQIQYRKGLTWEHIDSVQHLIPRPFLMHFRIATRGAKIPELTHPFPLGWQAFSEDLTGMAPAVLIHNGTWPDFQKYVPEGINPDAVSDTQTAAFEAETNENILNEVKWSNALLRAKGNGKAELIKRGHWTEWKGNKYSNLHWLNEMRYNSMTSDEWTEYWRTKHGYSRTTTPLIGREPIPMRKKGMSHQENRTQSNGKTVRQGNGPAQPLISKRAAKRAAKAARRAERRGKINRGETIDYDSAVKNYNSQRGGTVYRNPENENAAMAWGDRVAARPTRSWEAKPLFTEDELKGAKMLPCLTSATGKSAPCPYCKKEITQIPCTCGGFDEDESVDIDVNFEEAETEVYDIAELQALGMYVDDLEDLNALGESEVNVDNDMAIGLDVVGPYDEIEDYYRDQHNMVLDGNSPEDWKRVDDYIRAQGIKI